jgi:hypothetical protein
MIPSLRQQRLRALDGFMANITPAPSGFTPVDRRFGNYTPFYPTKTATQA